VVTQEIPFQRVHPAPLETCGSVADFDAVTGKLRLWCTTQAPHAHRTLYALVAGLPEHKIQVIAPDIGGGFGNKVPIYPATCAPSSLDRHRQAGEVDGGPHGEPDLDRLRPRLPHAREDRRPTATGGSARCGSTCSPTTARSTRPRSRRSTPAGFFHIFTGSYDLEAAYCTVKGVYTNKAPGGVAYRCSFRVTRPPTSSSAWSTCWPTSWAWTRSSCG
jgi:carbon-monoxide dehydrogenase large subunit